MSTNISNLAREITEDEGLKVELTVAQVREVLAVLGIRWRKMVAAGRPIEALGEWFDIMSACGKQSAHSRRK